MDSNKLREELSGLLQWLCIEWGFCIPPSDAERIADTQSIDADAFAKKRKGDRRIIVIYPIVDVKTFDFGFIYFMGVAVVVILFYLRLIVKLPLKT